MLHALIADDEAPARDRLRRLLAPEVEAGRLSEPDEAADGVEALDLLSSGDYDLVFLDVRMPGLDGFDVLERLDPQLHPAVVFTTAYDEYALRAFEASAVDYLLKPIEADRLSASVRRIVDARAGERTPPAVDPRLARLLDALEANESPIARSSEGVLRQFTVPARDRLLVIDASEVLAAEVHDGITNLYVEDASGAREAHRHIVSFTLDALEARLDPAAFMRVHRSAIVRLSAIRELIPWFSGRYKLVLAGGHEVVASRSRSRELKDRLAL